MNDTKQTVLSVSEDRPYYPSGEVTVQAYRPPQYDHRVHLKADYQGGVTNGPGVWMTPKEAREVALMLLRRAAEVEEGIEVEEGND